MDFKKGCLRWVGLLIFSAVLYHPLWAFDWPATLLFDQFELGDLAAWQTPNATGDATVSMSQSIRHSGAYAVKLTIPNNTKTREANIVKGFAKSDTIYYRTYFYLDNDFTMGSSDYLAIFAPATSMEGAIFHVSFKKNQNNEIILVAAYFGITYATGSTPVAKQTWNCLEGKYITGSGDGKVAIFLNGIEECSNSTMELPARPEKIVIGPNFMSEGATVSGTMYVDDVVVDRKPIGPCATGIFLAYPDLRGRVGAKTVAILTGDEPTDRLTASLTSTNGLNQKILDLPGPLNGRAEFPVVLNNIPASVYTLTVQLLDASAQEKARATFSFEKTYDGNPTFSIDADNNIIFNDKKFFPITSFGLGITSITDWATKGYINILYSIDWGGPLGIPGYKEYLDLLALYKKERL